MSRISGYCPRASVVPCYTSLLAAAVLSCLRNCVCEGIARQMQQIWKIQGKKFEEIYSGFVNGIRIPTDEVQHARLYDPSERKGSASPINPTDEGNWIEVKSKAKKDRLMCQDQFGKTSMNG